MKQTLTIIGIVFILLSVATYFYQEKDTESYFGGLIEDTDIDFPLRPYSYPTFVGGLVLLIIGLNSEQKNKNKK